MKVYEIAAVTDCGSYYQVDYLTTSLTQDFEKHVKFLGLNNIAAKIIRDSMDNNSVVRIVKDYQNIDVMPADLIIIKGDDKESLAFYKMIHLQKARQQVTHQQAVVSGIQVYEYISINNYLSDKGYFIHDDNREEVYLSILEADDETLVDKLEIYLNARDDLARASALENLYKKLYQNINKSTTEEEVLQYFSTFMANIVYSSK